MIAALARLKAHRAAERFEAKLLRFTLERRYAPDQPRVPAGNSDGGQWTSGGRGGDASSNDVALNNLPGTLSDAVDSIVTQVQETFANFDLRDDEGGAHDGHAIRDHVGKTEERLKRAAEASRFSVGPLSGAKRVGSFASLEAANKLVSSTLAGNLDIVSRIATGALGVNRAKRINAFFPSPTGKEAYLDGPRSQARIRDTYGVAVTLRHAPGSRRGFKVVTAFPFNE